MYIDENRRYWRYKTDEAFDPEDYEYEKYVNTFLSKPDMLIKENRSTPKPAASKSPLSNKQNRERIAQIQEEEWNRLHPETSKKKSSAANVAVSIEQAAKDIVNMATASEPKVLSKSDEMELKGIVDKKASDTFVDTIASLIDKNLISAGSVVKRKTALELVKFAFKLGLRYAKEGESITKYIKK